MGSQCDWWQNKCVPGEICGTLLPAVLESHLRKAQDGTETPCAAAVDMHKGELFAHKQNSHGIFRVTPLVKEMGCGLEDIVSSFDYAEIARHPPTRRPCPFHLSHDDLLNLARGK
jgi:hypothetical protein